VMSRLHRGRRLLQVALREEALRCGIVRKEPGEEDELAARRPVAAGAGGGQVYQLPRRQGSATKKP